MTDHDHQEKVALHRFGVIAEAANGRLTATERGALVRQIAARSHLHPDGTERRYSRGTIDRWLRAYRAGGLDALKPPPRSDTGAVRAHPELHAEAAALRLELPSRSAAQISSILFHRHGIRVAERTVREQLRRAGLHRAALEAEPKAFGRYEAERPNELLRRAIVRRGVPSVLYADYADTLVMPTASPRPWQLGANGLRLSA